jgi:hypothetical protein
VRERIFVLGSKKEQMDAVNSTMRRFGTTPVVNDFGKFRFTSHVRSIKTSDKN